MGTSFSAPKVAHLAGQIANRFPDKSANFYRSMTVDEESIRFDNVFSDLHTESYKEILDGNGFDISESYQSIALVSEIRES